MYPDSALSIRFIVSIYLYLSGLSYLIFHKIFWPLHYPLYKYVKSPQQTSKDDYLFERLYYRQLHAMSMQGTELKKNYYYMYATIARKYNLPFISEDYDGVIPKAVKHVYKLPNPRIPGKWEQKMDNRLNHLTYKDVLYFAAVICILVSSASK